MNALFPRAIAAIAYTVPPAWAYFAIKSDFEWQRAHYSFVCGTPAIIISFSACVASGFLSFAATGIRTWSLGWRPAFAEHYLELAMLFLPFFVAICYAGYACF